MRSATAYSSSSSSSSSSGTNASADDLPTAPQVNRPDEKPYSRLLTEQALSSSISGATAPSFRVYYSLAPGTVPFLWEASPGTPKHPAAGDHSSPCTVSAIPPLTPPPSYLSSPKTPLGSARRKQHRYSKAVGVLATILPRSASGSWLSRMLSSHSGASLSHSASSSTSSSSSAYDSPRRAAAVYYHDDDDDNVHGVPVTPPKSSAFCFQVAAARPYCCKSSAGSR